VSDRNWLLLCLWCSNYNKLFCCIFEKSPLWTKYRRHCHLYLWGRKTCLFYKFRDEVVDICSKWLLCLLSKHIRNLHFKPL
jgi:hypothetical protein